ncbi:aminotransferase, partial [candidate division MSBL1 archaeon SCGC-AAA261D19]
DSGVFEAVQRAGIAALQGAQNVIRKTVETYRKRRDLLIDGLHNLGIHVERPKATFYVWAPVPKRYNSMEFTKLLLDKCGIVPTPGIGFGEHGEGYVRFSLTIALERIKMAVERMEETIFNP